LPVTLSAAREFAALLLAHVAVSLPGLRLRGRPAGIPPQISVFGSATSQSVSCAR